MRPEILKLSLEKGLLLDRQVCEVLSGLDEKEAKEIIEIMASFKKKIINKNFFLENAQSLRKIGINGEKFIEKVYINLGLSIEISREIEKQPEVVDLENRKAVQVRNVKVINTVANNSRKITVDDFVKYFRSRIMEGKRILQERSGLDNLVSINKIGNQRQNFSIVGLVYTKRITKTKNLLLEIEDLTGKITVIVNQNKQELYDKAKDILIDSVIGIKGVASNNWFFANDIIFPDAVLAERVVLDRDEAVAFTSDTHVGSRNFLEKNFLKFIDWINGEVGNEKQREEARKVKYLFMTGDNIEGVGVYPGQESFLTIKDITKQYERLAEMIGKIRKDVTIIMCPGQHDAVRIAEPQPALEKEYAYPLHDLDNLILVSNPAMIEIKNEHSKGIKILMYHGASMTHFADEIESLSLIRAKETPSKIVRHMLKNRHLAPMHSLVTYIPTEERDELMIGEVPDIIATADLHRPDVDIYNNIMMICSSCWQSTTPFEEKVGNHPDPCKVPIMNLRSRQIKIMDFSDLEEEKQCIEKNSAIVCQATPEAKAELKVEVKKEMGEVKK